MPEDLAPGIIHPWADEPAMTAQEADDASRLVQTALLDAAVAAYRTAAPKEDLRHKAARAVAAFLKTAHAAPGPTRRWTLREWMKAVEDWDA